MHILFDFDGVLLDSRDNMRAAWECVQRRFDLEVDFDAYFAHVGKPFRTILTEIGIHESHTDIEREYAVASLANEDKLRVFNGVPELLGRLRDEGAMIGLLTSKDEERSRRFLELFSLPISEIYSPSLGVPGKPHPDLFIMAAERWGIRPSDLWFVGDMPVDCSGAAAAGARYVHCRWGYGEVPDQATCVDAPLEILELLL